MALAVAGLALAFPALRGSERAYGVLSLLLPIVGPFPGRPLLSMPRFVLGVFPVFIALGALVTGPRGNAAVLAVFGMLLGLDLARWVEWQFVA